MSAQTVGNMTIGQLEEVITRITTSVILTVDLNQNSSFREMREDLQSQIGVLGQRLDGVDKRLDGLEQKFDGLDEKVGYMAHHMSRKFAEVHEKIDQKFDEVNRKFDQEFEQAEVVQNEILNAIEERFENHEHWITSIERAA